MKRLWKSPWLLSLIVIVVAGLSAPGLLGREGGSPFEINAWQLMANPGPLTKAHARLEEDCSSCHTSVVGTPDQNCVQCHSNSSTLLLMQSTEFHTDIGSCSTCHREHVGRQGSISVMDHELLAGIVGRQLQSDIAAGDQEAALRRRHVNAWADAPISGGSGDMSELALDCNGCHSKEDPHVGYFGTACAACHVTAHWKLPTYTHPSDFSTDCRQCHLAPLSHSSPMFASMCATMLGKPGTQVADCQECHRITSWFDIRGAPWHKRSMGHGYGR